MRLLIITQKIDINDSILGFFHSWVQEFAKHTEKLTVICLQKGEYDLPDNVSVYSLGKENSNFQFPISNSSIFKRINYIYRFYGLIWQKRKEYDTIFVHMNPEYAVLAGWLWKLWNKKTALWYVHKEVSMKLRMAEKFVNQIFTASKDSCGLKSDKIKIVGHGIDLSKFRMTNDELRIRKSFAIRHSPFVICMVGRISPIKNQKLLMEAAALLRREDPAFKFRIKIIGAPHQGKDEEYLSELKESVREKGLADIVEFTGAVPNARIADYYREADLSVNLCPTGGMDKAVLEALACSTLVIVMNWTFEGILGEYKDKMLLTDNKPETLAKMVETINRMTTDEQAQAAHKLRDNVAENFGLEKLVMKITALIDQNIN